MFEFMLKKPSPPMEEVEVTAEDKERMLIEAFGNIVGEGCMPDMPRTEQHPNWQRYTYLLSNYEKAKNKSGIVIGVYGSPKAGKSTLLNTLLGEEVLPAEPIPTTGSLIDLKREVGSEGYRLLCIERRAQRPEHPVRKTKASAVREYLDKHGTQNRPYDSIKIKGPFPNALPFVMDNFTLRDTPGFETDPLDELLKNDSEKAMKAIADTDLCIFCVRGDAIGQERDMQIYEKFFRDRFCVHVITHMEGLSDDDKIEGLNDFYEKFQIVPDDIDPKVVAFTGIDFSSEPESSLINVGREELIEALNCYLKPELIVERIKQISQYITENPDLIGWPVPRLFLKTLEDIIKE